MMALVACIGCGGTDSPLTGENGDDDIAADMDENGFTGIVTEDYAFPRPLLSVDDASRDDQCHWSVQSSITGHTTIDACGSTGMSGATIDNYTWQLIETPTTAPADSYLTPGSDPCLMELSTPVTGRYTVQVKVQDSNGVWSDHPYNTGSCPYAYLTVISGSGPGIAAELIWNKGDRLDMDLFMVRYRPCGTMAYGTALQDRITPPEVVMPASCTSDDDCMGLPCEDAYCDISCGSDVQCQVRQPAWYCNRNNVCDALETWNCTTDQDCGGQGYCSPRYTGKCDDEHVCTRHSYQATNDTCAYNNNNPDWGEECDLYDNPTLVIDDIDGYGPEQIAFPHPAPGTYRVIARVYNDPHEIVAATEPLKAWVTIFLHGRKCGQWNAVFDRISMYWKVADIHWTGEGTSCTDIKPVAAKPAGADHDIASQCLDPENPACAHANPFFAFPAGVFDPCDKLIARSIWCDYDGDSDCILHDTCCPDTLP